MHSKVFEQIFSLFCNRSNTHTIFYEAEHIFFFDAASNILFLTVQYLLVSKMPH